LTHGYTLRRERRAELTGAIDRAVAAYTAADRAVSRLIMQVLTRQKEAVVMAAADAVTDQEVALRAAQFSMRLRLNIEHPVEIAFEKAHGAFTQTYLELGPAMTALARHKWASDCEAAVAAAQEQHHRFRQAFDDAMDQARLVVGPAD
jgi:hypothetical protein